MDIDRTYLKRAKNDVIDPIPDINTPHDLNRDPKGHSFYSR